MGEGSWLIDAAARELMLFAAVGLLIGGIDDIAVDLCYLVARGVLGLGRRVPLASLPVPAEPLPIAVFVPAWDEAAVIGAMLETALPRLDAANARVFVGTYPNDPATIDAVAAIAERDGRVRLVINPNPGPTTKADCLNVLWRALDRDDRASGRDTAAVVLHDAEDVVHPAELATFAALLADHDVVQLPVLPLVREHSPVVSGHYADEFGEAQNKGLVVRGALGAGLPLAGTGCAIATAALRRLAATRGGLPFDAASLTEDYELGLHLAAIGARATFARVEAGGELVAVKAFFPDAVPAATRQKARWMAGIALAGWDRIGWARPLALGDHWMRMRDRRALLAVVVLAVSYLAALAWGAKLAVHYLLVTPPADPLPRWILPVNGGLLVWRLAVRAVFTGRLYGWREAAWTLPRFFAGNVIALVAAPRALARYLTILAGRQPRWDKTRHHFPDLAVTNAA